MPLITQGKTNWKLLLIIIILAIIVGGGVLWYVKRPEKLYQSVEIKKTEISQNLTPQEVIKDWFDNQKKGEWQSVFADMVDVDGKSYSQECQEGFKKAFSVNVGSEFTLDIKNDLKTGGCKDLTELNQLANVSGFQLPDGQCAIVSLSYLTESWGSVDSILTLFKLNNDWKVMVYCKPLISNEVPIKIETTYWNTYSNKKWGVEIKYPNYFVLSTSGLDVSGDLQESISFMHQTVPLRNYVLFLDEISGKENLDNKVLMTNYLDLLCRSADMKLDQNAMSWKPIKMGGIDGLQTNYTCDKPLLTPLKQLTPLSEVIKDKKRYLLYGATEEGVPIEEYNKMLSTFRFLE